MKCGWWLTGEFGTTCDGSVSKFWCAVCTSLSMDSSLRANYRTRYVPAGMDISVFRPCTIQCNMRVYVKEMFGHTLELDVEESCIVGQDLVQGAVQCAHHPFTC